MKLSDLHWVVATGEFGFVGNPTNKSVIVFFQGKGSEISLRVPIVIDADVVPRNRLVAPSVDDCFGNSTT